MAIRLDPSLTPSRGDDRKGMAAEAVQLLPGYSSDLPSPNPSCFQRHDVPCPNQTNNMRVDHSLRVLNASTFKTYATETRRNGIYTRHQHREHVLRLSTAGHGVGRTMPSAIGAGIMTQIFYFSALGDLSPILSAAGGNRSIPSSAIGKNTPTCVL